MDVFKLSDEAVLRVLFRKVGIICKNARTFAFIGHMIHLSVGTGSLGQDVAGATRCLIAMHDFSKAEQEVSSQFFCEIADHHLPEIICGCYHMPHTAIPAWLPQLTYFAFYWQLWQQGQRKLTCQNSKKVINSFIKSVLATYLINYPPAITIKSVFTSQHNFLQCLQEYMNVLDVELNTWLLNINTFT